MALKLLLLPQNYKNCPAPGGSAPHTPSVMRLSCISLFNTGPKLDNWFKPPLIQILIPLLVAFTVADKFFKRLYGPDTKRAKQRCLIYTSLLSDMEAKLLKYRIICGHKISVFICKNSVYFSALPFSASAPSLRLLWRRHWCGLRSSR